MVSQPHSSASDHRARRVLTAALRFKWAVFSAIVIFVAVYWIDAWLAHHGLRRDVPLLDNFLLSALVFALGVAQQLRHERELKRQLQLMGIIADMNHHTRNALQVIVSHSVMSMTDASAIEEIRQAAAVKLAGSVPHYKTRWTASYKWTSGAALTPVDIFNASPGESDPYLSIFIRQPFPASFLPGHLEALLDLRNLLAQGYLPVLGQDGQMLYLVQSSRSVRGAVGFSF